MKEKTKNKVLLYMGYNNVNRKGKKNIKGEGGGGEW
jgi:hypothetical protein